MVFPPKDSNQVIAFCINLDRRPDRWASVQEKWKVFSDHPENLFRVKGIDTGSLVGCGQTHQLCVDHAKRKQMPWVLVLEDDVVFKPGARKAWAEQIEALEKYKKCDIFRSGLSAVKKIDKLSPPLFQFRDGSGLFFTLYMESSYDTVLKWMPNDGHLDRWLSWHTGLTNLTAAPFVATTSDGQSDIRNRLVEDSNIIDQAEHQLSNYETSVARNKPITTGVIPSAAPTVKPVPYLQMKPKGGIQRVQSYPQPRGKVVLGAQVRTSDGRILRQIKPA